MGVLIVKACVISSVSFILFSSLIKLCYNSYFVIVALLDRLVRPVAVLRIKLGLAYVFISGDSLFVSHFSSGSTDWNLINQTYLPNLHASSASTVLELQLVTQQQTHTNPRVYENKTSVSSS
jgi:hypothetical protein